MSFTGHAKKKKETHFVAHTFFHLLVVAALLLIALLVGSVFGRVHAGGQLAQTTQSTAGEPSPAGTTAPTATIRPAEFAIQVAEGDGAIECTTEGPQTFVAFFVSPPEGGYFEILSSTGDRFTVGIDNGPMKNGLYLWKAIPVEGFAVSGQASGSFEIAAECPGMGAATTTTAGTPTYASPLMTSPSPAKLLPPPEVVTSGFVVENGGTVEGDLLLRLVNTEATRVAFRIEGGSLAKTVDPETGVLHTRGTAVWTYPLLASGIPDGTYTITAVVTTASGEKIATGPMYVTTKNTRVEEPAVPVATDAQKPPRPQLKIFVDNIPIDPASPVDSDEVEFRVTTAFAEEIRIDLVNTETGVKESLEAGKDDLLSLPGLEVWSVLWSAEDANAGMYKAVARIVHVGGARTETQGLSLSVRGHETITEVNAPAKRPAYTPPSQEDAAKVLERVKDPGSCGSREECRIYCRSHADNNERCAEYAQELVTLLVVRPSLVDMIPNETLRTLIKDRDRRPRELPEIVDSVPDLTSYCADLSHEEVCRRLLIRNDLASETMLDARRVALSESEKITERIIGGRIGVRAFEDSDDDGVTDYDEVNLFGTDPNASDTDNDGFFDGAEILARTNPRGGMPASQELAFSVEQVNETSASSSSPAAPATTDEGVGVEDPRLVGTPRPEWLGEMTIAVADTKEETGAAAPRQPVVISGRSLPNAFVTLYIFSNPIVVTVKADAAGTWTYTLDKELSDGTHEVYSALTDAGGRILAKSEPLPFVKVAEAVTVGGVTDTTVPQEGFFSTTGLIALGALIVGGVGAALSVLGFLAGRKREHVPTEGPPLLG